MSPEGFVDYPGHPVLGWGGAFQRSPIRFLLDVRRTCGDFARIRLFGPVHVYLVSDPESLEWIFVKNPDNYVRGRAFNFLRRALGNGLLSSDGEYHLSHRRMIEPGLRRRRVAEYFDTILETTEEVLREWNPSADRAVDVNGEMLRLTMIVVGHVVFAVDLRSEAHRLRAALGEGAQLVASLSRMPVLLPKAIPTRTNRRIAAIARELDALIFGLLNQRRATGGEANGDVLSMLLHAAGGEGSGGAHTALSDREIRDEVIGLFGAGHETTAAWLSWTFYFLAQYPEVRTRLQAEIDAVIGTDRFQPEHVPRLVYAKQVLDEALRMVPPTWGNVREAVAPDAIQGRRVPAGARIFVCPYVVQHDARWYPDPERFDPDRFTADSQRARRRFTYFPFGGGTHHCIGKALAELEALVVLTAISRRYELHLEPGQTAEFHETTTVQPKGGLRMTVVPRR